MPYKGYSCICYLDVGNLVFVGQEPLYNANKFSSYVRYIHLKDVKITNQGPQVHSLDEGHINWRAALSLLPKDVPVGIKFPCGDQPRELLLKQLKRHKWQFNYDFLV